jgi:hypothetical protein
MQDGLLAQLNIKDTRTRGKRRRKKRLRLCKSESIAVYDMLCHNTVEHILSKRGLSKETTHKFHGS